MNTNNRTDSLLTLISNQLQQLIELQTKTNSSKAETTNVFVKEHTVPAEDIGNAIGLVHERLNERITNAKEHINESMSFVALKHKQSRLAHEFNEVNKEFFKAYSSRVFVAHIEDTDNDDYLSVVTALSGRGFTVVGRQATKSYRNQFKQAEKQDCRYIWLFVKNEGGSLAHEVKDLHTGEQVAADPLTWKPAEL